MLLYKRLQEVVLIITLGFIDNTNIIAYGRDIGETRALLEKAWAICDNWSKQVGLNFNPALAPYRDRGVITYLEIGAIEERKKRRKGTKSGGITNLYTDAVLKAARFNP